MYLSTKLTVLWFADGNIEAVSAVSSHSARAPLHPINPSLPMFFPEKAAKRFGF